MRVWHSMIVRDGKYEFMAQYDCEDIKNYEQDSTEILDKKFYRVAKLQSWRFGTPNLLKNGLKSESELGKLKPRNEENTSTYVQEGICLGSGSF